MTPILYTNTDAIRAAIGVDTADVADSIILDQNLEFQMIERLSDIVPTYEDIFDDSDEGERRLTLWCQYFGALTLLEDSVLAIPQKLQANNDQTSRFAVDFEVIKASLRSKLSRLERKLNPPTSLVTFSIMGVSAAGYNPVTGI